MDDVAEAMIPRLLAITPPDAARHPEIGDRWSSGLAEGLARANDRLPADVIPVAIQVRDKRADDDQLTELRIALRARHPERPLLLNGTASRARLLAFDGYHREAAATGTVRRGRTPQDRTRLVGQSTHTTVEVERAVQLGVDYLLFGPIFDTPAKRRYGPPQGTERLAEVCRAVTIPVLAVGGIDGSNIGKALRSGASGVAVIRAAGDPVQVEAMVGRLASQSPEWPSTSIR